MTPRRALTFASAVLFSATLAAQSAAPQQKPLSDEEFLKGAVQAPAQGLTAPVLLKATHPRYTSEAMRAKLQGTVVVQAVVGVDGKVDRARVTTSLDKIYGLDESALTSAREYSFVPGKMDGKAVPVVIELKLDFRLH